MLKIKDNVNLEELRKVPTKDLIGHLNAALAMGNQSSVNLYAYELTYRIYVPNDDVSFEEMLEKFGYKKIEPKGKAKIKEKKKR